MEKAEEGMATALEKMVQNAHTLLATLDNPPNDSITSLASTPSYPGSLACIIATQNVVEMLVEELQAETAHRLELERVVASGIASVVENGGGKGEVESGHVEEIEASIRTPSAQSSRRATEQSTSTPSAGLIVPLSKESAPENSGQSTLRPHV